MIGLSSLVYDPAGAAILGRRHVPSPPASASRRLSVDALLDGGVSVYDTGYAPADQRISLDFEDADESIEQWIDAMMIKYGRWLYASRRGVLVVAPQQWQRSAAGKLSLNLLVIDQLA